MNRKLSDIDPLAQLANDQSGEILDQYYKTSVKNIVGSYVDHFDVFNEVIQNALDAIDFKLNKEIKFQPKLWIEIDLQDSSITITDNGIGLLEDEFIKFLTPSVSINKERGKTRGNKGVGATYLAYGFNGFQAQSKRDGEEMGFSFNGARSWVESSTNKKARPKTLEIPFDCSELKNETSGTSINIQFGTHDKEVPRDLSWLKLETPLQWYRALRLKTPIGFVTHDTKRDALPDIELTVRQKTGSPQKEIFHNPEYLYLWDLQKEDQSPLFKSIDMEDIEKERIKLASKGKDTNVTKLPVKFRDNSCIYRIWDSNQILQEKTFFQKILNNPSQKELIEKHQISVFVNIFWGMEAWEIVNEKYLGLRKGKRLIKGGLQMATDWMVTGRAHTIPLNRNAHYADVSHVIVHFCDGQPDLGRKTFSAELEELAKELSTQIIYTFFRNNYHKHLRATSGSKVNIGPQTLHQDFKKAEKNYADHPLLLPNQFAMVSQPTDEQDVVTLFHGLLRPTYLEGYKILTTSSIDTYDCLFCTDFQMKQVYGENNLLGVKQVMTEKPEISGQKPSVLEFKYNLNGLMQDFKSHEKVEDEIDLAVCWSIGDKVMEDYSVRSLLDEEGQDREYYGSTHAVYGVSTQKKVFEIMCLEDLVLHYQNKTKDLLAKHKEQFLDKG